MAKSYWSEFFVTFFDPKMYQYGQRFTYFVDQNGGHADDANENLFRFRISAETDAEPLSIGNFRCTAQFPSSNNKKEIRYKTLESAFSKFLYLQEDARDTLKKEDIYFIFVGKDKKEVKTSIIDVFDGIEQRIKEQDSESTGKLYENLKSTLEKAESIKHKKAKPRASNKHQNEESAPDAAESQNGHEKSEKDKTKKRKRDQEKGKGKQQEKHVTKSQPSDDEGSDDPDTKIVEEPEFPPSPKKAKKYPEQQKKKKRTAAGPPVKVIRRENNAPESSRKRKASESQAQDDEGPPKKRGAELDAVVQAMVAMLEQVNKNSERQAEMVNSVCTAMMTQAEKFAAALEKVSSETIQKSTASSSTKDVRIPASAEKEKRTKVNLFGNEDEEPDVPEVPTSMDIDNLPKKRQRKTRGLKLAPEDDEEPSDQDFDPEKHGKGNEPEDGEDSTSDIEKAYAGYKENHDNLSDMEENEESGESEESEYEDDPDPESRDGFEDDYSDSEEEEEEEEEDCGDSDMEENQSKKKKSSPKKNANGQKKLPVPSKKKAPNSASSAASSKAKEDAVPVSVSAKEVFATPSSSLKSIADVINSTKPSKIRDDALDL